MRRRSSSPRSPCGWCARRTYSRSWPRRRRICPSSGCPPPSARSYEQTTGYTRSSPMLVPYAPAGCSTRLRGRSRLPVGTPAAGGAERHRYSRRGRPANVRRGYCHPVRPARRAVFRLRSATKPSRSDARVVLVRTNRVRKGPIAVGSAPSGEAPGCRFHPHPLGARRHTAGASSSSHRRASNGWASRS